MRETSRDAKDSISVVGAKSIAAENNGSKEDVSKGGKTNLGATGF